MAGKPISIHLRDTTYSTSMYGTNLVDELNQHRVILIEKVARLLPEGHWVQCDV
jgi:hypothetical protein